jgi:uncharacterized protein YqgC (DUF456 family)
MSSLLLWLVTTLLLLLGLAGTVVPGIPGIILVFAGILFFGFFTQFAQISPLTITIFGLITAAAIAADYLAAIFGSKIAGGKTKAIIGAGLGTFIGLFFAPVGLFLGAFLGALAGAYFEGASSQKALKIAFVSALAILASNLLQFILALVLILAFAFAVIF